MAETTEFRDNSSTSKLTILSIVLPVYNEIGNITPLTDELVQIIESNRLDDYRPYEIIFVDDGSTDGSQGILTEIVKTHDHVKTILLRRNFGQSAALAAGIDAAKGEVIITMDSDMQNDPENIPQLIEKLEDGHDCVSGWRKNRQDSISKTIPSKIQTYLAWIAGPRIHDFGCTLKAYKRDAIQDINLHGEGHRYIPAHLHRRGYSVTEIPVNHRPRKKGGTKYGTKRLVKGSLDLLFNVFRNRFSTRPLHFLGSIGVLFMGVGGLTGLHALIIRYVYEASLTPRMPRLVLVALLILFGFQLFLLGFLAEMIVDLRYLDDNPYRIEKIVE